MANDRRRRRAAAAFGAAAVVAVAAMAVAAVDGVGAQEIDVVDCVICHGENGASTEAGVPSLGGQPELYLLYQLVYFRGGQRDDKIMSPLMEDAADDDLRAMAAAFAAMAPPPRAEEGRDDDAYARGAALAAGGRCASCHRPDYAGLKHVPRLAGQDEAYLVKAMMDYKSGVRIGVQAAMPEALSHIDDHGVADLAHYFAHYAE